MHLLVTIPNTFLRACRLNYLKVPGSNPVGSLKYFMSHFLPDFYMTMLKFSLLYLLGTYSMVLDLLIVSTKTHTETFWPWFNRKVTNVKNHFSGVVTLWKLRGPTFSGPFSSWKKLQGQRTLYYNLAKNVERELDPRSVQRLHPCFGRIFCNLHFPYSLNF